MIRKIVSGMILTWLLIGMLTLAFNSTIAESKETHAALQELWVQIDGAKAYRKGYGNEGWVNITVIEVEFFNLLPLLNLSFCIATCELPVGSYTEMEFHVVDAFANTTQEPCKELTITTPWLTVKTFFTIDRPMICPSLPTFLIDITVNENIIVHGGMLPSTAKGEVVAIIY